MYHFAKGLFFFFCKIKKTHSIFLRFSEVFSVCLHQCKTSYCDFFVFHFILIPPCLVSYIDFSTKLCIPFTR